MRSLQSTDQLLSSFELYLPTKTVPSANAFDVHPFSTSFIDLTAKLRLKPNSYSTMHSWFKFEENADVTQESFTFRTTISPAILGAAAGADARLARSP